LLINGCVLGYNEIMEEDKNQKQSLNRNLNYISLFDAAKFCSYSEPYLRLRSRQGKLKSIKLGKKWMTTRQWLADYEARVCQWRAESESKKNKLGGKSPDNESSDAELSPAGDTAIDAPIEYVDYYAPRAALCSIPARVPPPPPPARPVLSGFAGGQIIPPPKEAKTGDNLNHGAIGAIASGSLIALVLFFAAQPQALLDVIRLPGAAIGQANISRSAEVFDQADNLPKKDFQIETDFLSPPSPVQEGALETLVARIADFFNSSSF